MRHLVLLLSLAAAAAAGQSSTPARSLGTWQVEYERTITRMHAEPIRDLSRGRMSLRSVGDSVFGEMTLGDSTSKDRVILRGTAKSGAWTVYTEQPNPTGLSVLLVPIEVAIEWLKETMHDMQPVVVRFDLIQRGDSLTGTRIVTGGLPGTPALTSTVRGIRATP